MNATPRGPARALATLLLALVALFSAAALGVTQESDPGSPERALPELPVTAISLFTSGVGYFQHDAVVSGNQDVDLVVNSGDINDLLKSLVLQDFDGGLVQVVTYPSQDPLARILGSFSLSIADNPSLAELVNRARGEEVIVESDRTIRGVVLGVESRNVRFENGTRQVSFLNLTSSSGLLQINLEEVSSLRFSSATLQAELDAALAVIADNRQQNQRTITIRFRGDGERRIRVGYVRSVPVWKTSYRLVLDEQDGAQIQGWAIVENTSELDWRDVSLGLVSGQPISFVMDLYSPIYRTRPRVENQTGVAVAPQLYDRDVARSAPIGEMNQAPSAAMALDESLFSTRSLAAAEAEPIDLSRGVQSAATLESGAVYRIAEPVSVPRRGAALIPIVVDSVPAERIAIYDHTVLANRPLAAVELDNATELQLPAGPATIFDEANYAGDARLPEMLAGEERLLSYAVELATTVVRRSSPTPEEITRIRVINGVLEVTMMQRSQTEYLFERLDGESIPHIVVHPKRAGWEIMSSVEPVGETDSAYRYRVAVPGNQTTTFVLEEERVRQSTVGLFSIRDDQIAFYVSQQSIDPETAAILERIRELRAQITSRESARREIEQQLSTLYREQDRIRSNLEVVQSGTELYDRYIQSLTSQEDTIERLQAELLTAREEEELARIRLRDYIESL